MKWKEQIIAGVHVLPEQRSILDNPNLPLNDPEVWRQVFGDEIATDTGITLNEEKALMYAPVWQAVSMIAGDVGCLPFNLYRRRPDLGDNSRELAAEDGRHYIVNIQPTPWMTAQQFWETYMIQALIWNQAFALIVWDNAGRLKELRHLSADRTQVETINGELYYVTEYHDANGTPKLMALHPWEVLHIQGISPNGLDAPRFIKMARNSITLGLAQQKFASKFFANGGRIGGILELPASMPKPVMQTVEEGFRKTYEGVDNPFKTVVLRDSARFHAAQMSPVDSQMVEAGEAQVRTIARWFNLTPSKLGLSDSVAYNSKSEDNQNYLDSTLKRWLKKLQGECNIKLLSEDAQTKYFFEHDVNELVEMDEGKRYTTYQLAIQNKIMNPNEVRAREHMLPYIGGDVYANPNGALGGEGTATEKPANDSEDPKKDQKKETEPRSYDWRARRVLYNLTATARHKSKKPAALIEWLDNGFPLQKEEWRTVSRGAAEPDFFVTFRAQLNDIVQTATEEALVSVVDQFATNFERTA